MPKKPATLLSLMESPSIQLTPGNHPFIDLLPLLPALKYLYDKGIASKGDIFEKCIVLWSQHRLFLLESLHELSSGWRTYYVGYHDGDQL